MHRYLFYAGALALIAAIATTGWATSVRLLALAGVVLVIGVCELGRSQGQ